MLALFLNKNGNWLYRRGEIEIDNSIQLVGEGLASIKVNGFKEIYNAGTVSMELDFGHLFKVATLPAIIMLKLIAYDDRPEQRLKDPRDIASIINHFFELQANMIYSEHLDLFTEETKSLSIREISAVVIGREIKKICAHNRPLWERLQDILQGHIQLAENSVFVRNMVYELQNDVEECTIWLRHLLSGLT